VATLTVIAFTRQQLVLDALPRQSPSMGTKLSPQDASAYEALDRLLYREWDPIGISGAAPEDEYRM